MAAKLTTGPKDEAATAAEQLAAHLAGMKEELLGLERRRAAVDEKNDPSAAARLDARLKHVKDEIRNGAKARERAVVASDGEQATA